MTNRGIRYQAAVMSGYRLLLLRCRVADGRAFWLLPGGGREPGESEAECVLREVREEAGVDIVVGSILYEIPAEPPDGTYTSWRTYHGEITRGEPRPGGGEGTAELTAVRWLALDRQEAWEPELQADPFLFPQLLRIRAALCFPPPSLNVAAG